MWTTGTRRPQSRWDLDMTGRACVRGRGTGDIDVQGTRAARWGCVWVWVRVWVWMVAQGRGRTAEGEVVRGRGGHGMTPWAGQREGQPRLDESRSRAFIGGTRAQTMTNMTVGSVSENVNGMRSSGPGAVSGSAFVVKAAVVAAAVVAAAAAVGGEAIVAAAAAAAQAAALVTSDAGLEAHPPAAPSPWPSYWPSRAGD